MAPPARPLEQARRRGTGRGGRPGHDERYGTKFAVAGVLNARRRGTGRGGRPGRGWPGERRARARLSLELGERPKQDNEQIHEKQLNTMKRYGQQK